MIFGSAPYASSHLGAPMIDPGTIVDPASFQPIRIEQNGVDVSEEVDVESITKTDTLGQPVSASLRFINPVAEPSTGDTIRIRFHESVEFAGTINRVTKVTDDLAVIRFDCACLDWGQVLTRRQIRRNFSNMTVHGIVTSAMQNELLGEPLTIGTIDNLVVVPLVDASKSSRAFDLFRDLANATGQSFRVNYDKSIQMKSTTVEESPLLLNETNVLVESTQVTRDRETYRNRQTIQVIGTPADTNEDALIVTVQVSNDDQIAARQAVEGGTGIYEEFEEITHPASNLVDDLLLMAGGYAQIRLATSGTPRTTVSVRVRGYGFRAGQIAQFDIPTLGITGEYIIQRVSMAERAGQFLFHDLELTESNVQRRAYESWIAILSRGKIAIQVFGSVVHNAVSFTTPGAANWTVPAGVTVVTLTLSGASGGGGGGGICNIILKSGGNGGNGGKVVASVNVVAGQELNLTIGAKGLAGANNVTPIPKGFLGTPGTGGTVTTVYRSGVLLAQANAGGGGGANICPNNGVNGTHGGGSNGIVTVGGGKVGGTKGMPAGFGGGGTTPTNGQNATITIEW